MNLLESLALRALDAVAAIEPPRVPFVSVYPGGIAEAAGSDAAAPRELSVPPRAVVRSAHGPADAAPQETPRAPERTGAPPVVHPAPERVREARDEPPPDTPRVAPRRDRVLDERSAVPPPAELRPGPPAPPQHDAARIEPKDPPVIREVHHTDHHHWLERRIERIVHEVERTAPAPHPAARELEPPLPSSAPAVAPMPPPAGGVAGSIVPAAALGKPERVVVAPPVPPAVHVTIDRVVVRMQPPAAAPRSETTRPAPPAIGLDAYTAARRRKP